MAPYGGTRPLLTPNPTAAGYPTSGDPILIDVSCSITTTTMTQALAKRGEANIIVATGASQFEMLAALVAEPDINWNRVTGFHLDEYVGLAIDHPASFRGYLW